VPVLAPVPFVRITAGERQTCALDANGVAYCWGDNYYGELGDGTYTDRNAPVRVATTVRFQQIVTSSFITCGLSGRGEVYCWGDIVGYGVALSPILVSGTRTFRSIELSGWQGCGIGTDGRTYCFERVGHFGLVGNPMLVPSPEFASLSGGEFSSCGLTRAGRTYCWGSVFGNTIDDVLGATNVDSMSANVPVVGNHSFKSIASGFLTRCGLTTANEIWCWGYNFDASMPIPRNTSTMTPVLVTETNGLAFASLEKGGAHTCGLATNSLVYCWGNFSTGQLGDGRTGTGVSDPMSFAPVLARRVP
jgi:alpha-tubulin suppressor-like RCC1 family protein